METPHFVDVNGYIMSYDALEDLGSQLDLLDETGLKRFEEAMILLKHGYWQLVEDDQELKTALTMVVWLMRRLKKDAALVRKHQRHSRIQPFDLIKQIMRSKRPAFQKPTLKTRLSHGKRKHPRF